MLHRSMCMKGKNWKILTDPDWWGHVQVEGGVGGDCARVCGSLSGNDMLWNGMCDGDTTQGGH